MTVRIRFTVVRSAIAALAIVMFAGCASGPKVFTNKDPSADFSNYNTYNFASPLGTDKPGAGSTSLLSKYLISATEREMDSRGYAKSDDPDLLINFYVHTEEKIRATQSPTVSGGYYGYRGYGAWGGYAGTDTQVTQYTEGTLNIDLVDTARDQLVWEGTLVGRLTDEIKANLEASASRAVQTAFRQYPYVAGSNVPQPTAEE